MMIAATTFYLAGCLRLQKENALKQVLGAARIGAFLGGMLTLIVALISPLDALAEHLFSAHMAQHMLLMVIAPPLFVCSRPIMTVLWAFPLVKRKALGAWWNSAARLKSIYDVITTPWGSWALASVTLWIWHIPNLYDWALANEYIHAMEHFCFFLTSLLYWRPVITPHHQRQQGVAMVSVITFALHSSFLGALLTFASRPLYYHHSSSDSVLTPLEDQQIAGLIMWIPTNLIYLAVISWLFIAWLEKTEHAAIRRVPFPKASPPQA